MLGCKIIKEKEKSSRSVIKSCKVVSEERSPWTCDFFVPQHTVSLPSWFMATWDRDDSLSQPVHTILLELNLWIMKKLPISLLDMKITMTVKRTVKTY
ncbi:hypothetical protein QZH41_018833, partial [Actinostola sp. cb2023]